MKMAISYDIKATDDTHALTREAVWKSGNEHLNAYRINEAIREIWFGTRSEMNVASIETLDEYIQNEQPFKKMKGGDREGTRKDIEYLLHELRKIAIVLYPFMPDTAKKIDEAVISHTMPESLFPRRE